MNEYYVDDKGFLHFYDPSRDKGSIDPPPKDWDPLWTCDRLFARIATAWGEEKNESGKRR